MAIASLRNARFRSLVIACGVLALGGCNGTAGSVLSGVAAGGGTTTLPVPADPTTITTAQGAVHGAASSGLIRFLGVPYAAPPTGSLRFKAPQARASWTTTLQATAFGPRCPQLARGAGPGGQTATEDCLYLNIYERPPTGTAMPVYMFVHGGGFSGGSGADYDGSWLAATGVIVVTVNYRLGIFGYLAHAALDDGNGDTGNYGLEDQQAALRWIKQNIAAFGGDVNNVTLGGESAGAMSVCQNIVSPGAQGLFVRAIVESGPCSQNWRTLATAESLGATVAASAGCSGTNTAIATCLRAASITTLLSAGSSAARNSLYPSVGGSDIPTQPRTAFGRYPLLLGGNNLELGIGGAPSGLTTEAAYETALTTTYGSYENFVLQEYPASNYASITTPQGYNEYVQALLHAESDYDPQPGAPEIAFCNDVTAWAMAAASGKPVYAYEFNDQNAPGSGALPEGAVHTAELQYLFQYSSGGPTSLPALSATSQTLSDTMVQYWSNYIKTGNPNGGTLTSWPAYTGPATALQLVPGAVATGTDTNAEHHCPFWNGYDFANGTMRKLY